MILNLGCGDRPIEGAVNLDVYKREGVDIEHDLEKPLPFGDNEFDQVVALHILEHIKNLPQLMGEIHRVARQGARVLIEIPHFTNPTFYDDVTHVRPWTEKTADFLCEKRFDGKRCYQGQFRVLKNITIGEPWSREKPTVVVVELEVVKGE